MTCRLSENWLTSLVRSVLTGITPQSLRQKCNPCERTNYQDWECWCTEEFQGSAITARLALKAHICGFCGAPKSQKAVVEVVFLRTSGSSAPAALWLALSFGQLVQEHFPALWRSQFSPQECVCLQRCVFVFMPISYNSGLLQKKDALLSNGFTHVRNIYWSWAKGRLINRGCGSGCGLLQQGRMDSRSL